MIGIDLSICRPVGLAGGAALELNTQIRLIGTGITKSIQEGKLPDA
jgi:hypothetical protein